MPSCPICYSYVNSNKGLISHVARIHQSGPFYPNGSNASAGEDTSRVEGLSGNTAPPPPPDSSPAPSADNVPPSDFAGSQSVTDPQKVRKLCAFDLTHVLQT